MYSEDEMFDEAPKVTRPFKAFFTLKPYKNSKFFNPCKKCIVQAACTQHCENRKKYAHGKEIKMAVSIGMGMLLTAALMAFISMMLFTHEYKGSSLGFTIFWIAFFTHFWCLVGDS